MFRLEEDVEKPRAQVFQPLLENLAQIRLKLWHLSLEDQVLEMGLTMSFLQAPSCRLHHRILISFALLRATLNPNPSTLRNSISVIGNHMISEPAAETAPWNARTLGLDPISQVSSSPSWKSNQHQQNGFTVGEAQNSGIQELYQRLRSSTNYYTDNPSAIVRSNVTIPSSTSSTILGSAPVAGGELGYWNPAFSWSDLPTTNGAYP
ncbi:hypothetical protein OIU84_005964 [Salix udensis]|uniref:Uncharacterized protein n=1 Tax=Salix udensis TaxID=889485 RepID=A0AAD6JZM6_9ROSI|nr:hypothetical protein OIU84_005964 [Salix udensis]